MESLTYRIKHEFLLHAMHKSLDEFKKFSLNDIQKEYLFIIEKAMIKASLDDNEYIALSVDETGKIAFGGITYNNRNPGKKLLDVDIVFSENRIHSTLYRYLNRYVIDKSVNRTAVFENTLYMYVKNTMNICEKLLPKPEKILPPTFRSAQQ